MAQKNTSCQPTKKSRIGKLVDSVVVILANTADDDSLDLHCEIARLAWENKLHEAPLNEPHRILDIGTDTGI